MEEIKNETDRGEVPLVAEREQMQVGQPVWRQMLPVRNQCTDISGHVTFKEQNGLIHGGIVVAPNYTLTCRGFRLEWMDRYRGSHSYKRDEHREVVVAGVCEQKRHSGQIIDTWSTASHLPLRYIDKGYYSSTSISLPQSAIQRIIYDKGKHGRRHWRWFGYYIPESWGWNSAPDTGNPTYEYWGELGGEYIWDKHPSGAASIESPFSNPQYSCTPGYVICTPYIKVYHPDPNMDKMTVQMIGAYRQQSQRKTAVSFYGRDAQWYSRSYG